MLVTLTIIRYQKRRHIFFAFLAMVLFRIPLWRNKRSRFWKLMGSGKNGSFDKKPDLMQWAIFSVSNLKFKDVQIKHFNADLLIYKLYGPFISKWLRFFECDTITYLMESIEGHGLWDGKEVFGTLPRQSDYEGHVAVLTRATIRISRLNRFWKYVDGVANKMTEADGFITSYGIGEMPWIKQATFSIWQNKDAMKNFAYQQPEHKEVIQKTRQEKWYSEDMFVRFKITGCIGNLKGSNPLKGKL
ncbi:MAG: spheroidene monooxygenase [Bacteroidetes bacterium]|nr:spheroidene monooxygenase [Bacteroidota bacterium]